MHALSKYLSQPQAYIDEIAKMHEKSRQRGTLFSEQQDDISFYTFSLQRNKVARLLANAVANQTFQFDIADGLVHFRNSAAPGSVAAAAQLVYGGSSVNAWMAINDVLTLTIMCVGAAGSYINGLTIDGSSQTVNWANGTAPSDGSAMDIYVFTIVKTAGSAFTVFGNQTKTA